MKNHRIHKLRLCVEVLHIISRSYENGQFDGSCHKVLDKILSPFETFKLNCRQHPDILYL